MDYLGKGEMLTNRDATDLGPIFERNKLFVHMEDISGIFYFRS